MNAEPILEHLLQRFSDDGELTDEEFAWLTAKLESDESARAEFIRWRDQEANLYWDFSGTRSGEWPLSPTGALADSVLHQASRHPLLPSVTVAFVSLAVLLFGLALWPISWWLIQEPVVEKVEPTRENVARLVRILGANWISHAAFAAQFNTTEDAANADGRTAERLRVGSRFASGEWLFLERGIAEIDFKHGAAVVLSGPCAFQVQEKGSGRLAFGKLVGRCATKRSQGFVLETPLGRVVDLGTEFGVDVGAEGNIDIKVFEGKVAFKQVADRSAGRGQTISAGESLHVSSKGSVKRSSTGNERQFVRRVNDQWVGLPNVIAAFRRDFTPGVVGQPSSSPRWKYLWNQYGPIGDPANYESLVWHGGKAAYSPSATSFPLPPPASFLRISADIAHPGIGSKQQGGSESECYAIAAYVVETPGRYELVNGRIELLEKVAHLEQSLDLIVHVDNAKPAFRRRVVEGDATAFDVSLGDLSAGQVIYVAVGADGFAGSDTFRMDFAIACTPANND